METSSDPSAASTGPDDEKLDAASEKFFSHFGKYLLVTSGWIILVMTSCHFTLQWMFKSDYATRSNFGNQFVPVGVFFSGVSGFLLLITILQQYRNIRSQTGTLKLQHQALMLQQQALEQQLETTRLQQQQILRENGEQQRANRLAELGFHVELQKQRLAHHRARGGSRFSLRRDHDESARLLQELEDLLARYDIVAKGQQS